MVTFAHLSDCHIGGWRESDLRELSLQSLSAAFDYCLHEKVDFVVIAGDLFNASVPSIDALKHVAGEFKRLRDHQTPIYIIPGSHDYSPRGKTMIDVLEKSGLCTNVFKFNPENGEMTITVDPKTGTQLAGVVGLRGALESQHYRVLNADTLRKQLKDDVVKIFLFHTLIREFTPKEFEMIDADPVTVLPQGFDYYAGGHPHFVFQTDMRHQGYGLMTYPGPLFPNNVKELEDLRCGGMYIIQGSPGMLTARHVPLSLKRVVSFSFDAEGKSALSLEREMTSSFLAEDTRDALVTVRIAGTLAEGKPSDLSLKEMFDSLGAFAVLKNTTKLSSKEFEEIVVRQGTIEDVEQQLVCSHLGQIQLDPLYGMEAALVDTLMRVLHVEKKDGERVSDFQSRVFNDLLDLLHLRSFWGGAYAPEED